MIKPIIPKTYAELTTLMMLRQFRTYCQISDAQAASIFTDLLSGKLVSAICTNVGTLALKYADSSDPAVMPVLAGAAMNKSIIADVALTAGSINVRYTPSYLAARSSSSSGGDSGGGSSNNNNNNNNNNNTNH